MTRSPQHPWLNYFAWLTAGATFALLGIGGLVTSKGAGMAVPDWPTTYGYNLFLFPIHLWTGGIFYEHTHRLVASFVGLLTAVLAVWLWQREPRAWLRWLGIGGFIAVVVQGLLGGLRVTLYKDEIGIVHAALAQSFFVAVTILALFVSGGGDRLVAAAKRQPTIPRTLGRVFACGIVLTFCQLLLGATMRHQHAGLAIPDFPLAYGQLWPKTDPEFLARMNSLRLGVEDFKPITAFQVWLHMAHRIGALLIVVTVGIAAWRARRELGSDSVYSKLAMLWIALVLLQASFGAATVWTNKAADVATIHVLLGALTLLLGSILNIGAFVRQTSAISEEPARAHPSVLQSPPLSRGSAAAL